MAQRPPTPGPDEIPDTPLLKYFRSPLFKGPKGKKWGANRIAEATKWCNNPDQLAAWFAESTAAFERCYYNCQPFHPRGHSFSDTHGQSLAKTADVAKRLSKRDVWEVPNDSRLDFRYLDREIEIARSKPAPKTPPDAQLIVDLFLANASDRTPILCEIKIGTDECAFYALIQLLTQAAYAATPGQRARLVLFGSQPDFVLREAVPGSPAPIDLYILLVAPTKGGPYDEITTLAIRLSKKLVADTRVRSKIRRIAWLEGQDDGNGGLSLSALPAGTP